MALTRSGVSTLLVSEPSVLKCRGFILGVAEKRDELKRSFKHPAPFSSPDLAMPYFDRGMTGCPAIGCMTRGEYDWLVPPYRDPYMGL
jgi:hypothetical protein